MRRLAGFFLVALIVVALVGWFVLLPRGAVARNEPALAAGKGDAMRGAVVLAAAGCAACHATPVPDGTPDLARLGGGLRLKTAFGTFVVPNISSDPQDGIGRWSDADLANALLSGTSPDGRHYYPAFPYTTYAHMRLEDVADLAAYLRTLPTVAGRQPPHDLAFPYNQRWGLGLWKALYLDRSPVEPVTGRSDSWNRGHYLVEALGHCAECHSPRDAMGGIVPARRFAGGPEAEGKGFVPNITQAPDALGKWTADDIVELLTSGNTPDFDNVSGSMTAVVRNTSRLPPSDRAAVADYLKSLPAVRSLPPGK